MPPQPASCATTWRLSPNKAVFVGTLIQVILSGCPAAQLRVAASPYQEPLFGQDSRTQKAVARTPTLGAALRRNASRPRETDRLKHVVIAVRAMKAGIRR
jgi:hypothetical protein